MDDYFTYHFCSVFRWSGGASIGDEKVKNRVFKEHSIHRK